MIKFKSTIYTSIFLILIALKVTLVSSDIEYLGCCMNPASILSCSDIREANRDIECCPDQTNYPHYYQSTENPDGPLDYQDCINNYFTPNQVCSDVSDCSQGCCCEQPPSLTYKISCSETFYEGEAACTDVCQVTTECNDGIDNDNDGCIDYTGGDGGCDSSEDESEEGGICNVEVDCNYAGSKPKLSNLIITPLHGEKKLNLEWSDQCPANIVKYEISRCQGSNCTDFFNIGTTTSNKYIDESENLKFNTNYRYQIKGYYSLQTYKPSIEAASNLGDLECWFKKSTDSFCIIPSYYDQYRQYLIQYEGFVSSSFDEQVLSTYGYRFNTAFYCNKQNNLVQQGPRCVDELMCIILDGNPTCMEQPECNYMTANPFGLYYTESICENNKLCFFDRSFTIPNNCYGCNSFVGCIDYKSKQSCEKSKCNNQDCEWKSLSAELGTGVCVDKTKDNCKWCTLTGTPGYETNFASNQIFEGCSKQKSDLLSVPDYKCYYKDGDAVSCGEILCTDYSIIECGTQKIILDVNNNIVNPSNDPCKKGVCQWIKGKCKKNTDNDDIADCENIDCEKDYFKPRTILIPYDINGLIQGFTFQIFDKISTDSPEALILDENYTIYLCNDCFKSHPFDISTTSKSFEIIGLDVYESNSLNKVMRLNEGTNTIKFYSQDSSKNVGLVEEFTLYSSNDSDPGPRIAMISISDSNQVGDIFYTSILKPRIQVVFYQEVLVTYAILRNIDTGRLIAPEFSNEFSNTFDFEFLEDLSSGTYVFEIEARTREGIEMDKTEILTLIVDPTPLTVDIKPGDGDVLIEETTNINITFNKEVLTITVMINGEDITDILESEDNIAFSATLDLTDGSKIVNVQAQSYAGQELFASNNFIVNARPVNISLKEPSYGVSSTYTFDVVVETNKEVHCKYSFEYSSSNSTLNYDYMQEFPQTDGLIHKITNFNQIPDGNTNIFYLHVICDDTLYGKQSKIISLSVDSSLPQFIAAFAYPNPVVEIPAFTKLRIQNDDNTFCKYSTTTTIYSQMENQFPGFDNSPRTIHNANITSFSSDSVTYYVACENTAGLISATESIIITVDTDAPLEITHHTPLYFNQTAVKLLLETNKKVECRYSQTDETVTPGNLFGPADYVHEKSLNLAEKSYTFYVKCYDIFLQEWSDVIEVPFTIDTTPPIMTEVNDSSDLLNPEITWITDKLRVKWSGVDNVSGIDHFLYTIEEFGTLQPLINWTVEERNNEWMWINVADKGISLIDTFKYYFRVKAKNKAGVESSIMESDGITIDLSSKPADCTNNLKDPTEIDIDCGGPCGPCDVGKACQTNEDCISGYCIQNICVQATCEDGIKQASNSETDIDCGGPNCPPCTEGLECNVNSDCENNNCAFGLCNSDTCNDGILSPTESDVDCGGPCPIKCGEGMYCGTDSDCEEGIRCINDKCKFCADDDLNCNGIPDYEEEDDVVDDYDKDQDGMDDEWEILHGLDPNNPSDALDDSDSDDLINQDEYLYRTDPGNKDTDEDGHDDNVEVIRNTDPLDPKSKPKSRFGTIFLIILVGALAGVIIFIIYTQFVQKKPSKQIRQIKPSPPRTPLRQQRPGQIPSTRPLRPNRPIRPSLKQMQMSMLRKKRYEEEKKKRAKTFDVFSSKEPEKKPSDKSGEKTTQTTEVKTTISKISSKDKPKKQSLGETSKTTPTISKPTKIKKKKKKKKKKPKGKSQDPFKKLQKMVKQHNKK